MNNKILKNFFQITKNYFIIFYHFSYRIGALSYDILRSVKGLEELSLAYNIIREIPKGTFKYLTSLKILNMYGNQIAMIDQDTFAAGAESNLEYLDLTCTGLINKDIIFLGKLVNLKHLILSYMKLKDKGDALQTMMKTLEKLEIF